MNGVLVIDKPPGMTSHDVVSRIRRVAQERSVGHLGTLDPMATGVLPLVLGQFTRLAQFYLGAPKAYEGEIRFGFATDTYDADGQQIGPSVPATLSENQVKEAAGRFHGSIRQTPPPFSAKKVAGVPAYKLARKKQAVVLQPVTVEVESFEIIGMSGDVGRFRARVSSGTYIRSIAHEMGVLLGVGAHLASLRRTAVAEFSIAQAITLDKADKELSDSIIHPRRVLPDLPCVTATEESANKIRHGQAVNLPDMSRAKMVKVFAGQSDLIAIATRIAGTLFQPKVVFASL